MCFGGAAKPPAIVAPPAPLPTPTPTNSSPIATAQARATRLSQMQYGLASTIKTSPQGITGTGANLTAPALTGVNTTGGG